MPYVDREHKRRVDREKKRRKRLRLGMKPAAGGYVNPNDLLPAKYEPRVMRCHYGR